MYTDQELVNNIKNTLQRIPDLLKQEGPFLSLKDIFNRCPKNSFEEIMGVSLDFFKNKCEVGSFNSKSLNTKIQRWNYTNSHEYNMSVSDMIMFYDKNESKF